MAKSRKIRDWLQNNFSDWTDDWIPITIFFILTTLSLFISTFLAYFPKYQGTTLFGRTTYFSGYIGLILISISIGLIFFNPHSISLGFGAVGTSLVTVVMGISMYETIVNFVTGSPYSTPDLGFFLGFASWICLMFIQVCLGIYVYTDWAPDPDILLHSIYIGMAITFIFFISIILRQSIALWEYAIISIFYIVIFFVLEHFELIDIEEYSTWIILLFSIGFLYLILYLLNVFLHPGIASTIIVFAGLILFLVAIWGDKKRATLFILCILLLLSGLTIGEIMPLIKEMLAP